MEHFTMTPESLKTLINRNFGRLRRENQIFPWEEAYDLVCQLGKMAVPGFTVDDANRLAYEQIARWLVSDTSFQTSSGRGYLTRGIYLQGPTGSGKSVCLDLFRVAAKAMRLAVFSPAFPKEIASDPSQRYNDLAWTSIKAEDICQKYEKDGDIEDFKKTPVLCIHDLGSEPLESLYMGCRRNVLRIVLEARGDRSDLMTLITSNIPLSDLVKFYGERVQSRVAAMCNVITLGGKDRRIENNANK